MRIKPGRLRTASAVSVALSVVGLAACGAPVSPGSPGEPEATEAGSTLTIRFTPAPEADTKVWTLTCQPPGGSHPAPEAACTTLAELTESGDPFVQPPADEICPQIYGGPQQAKVEGEWRGASVSATYSRRNGCDMKRWDEMEPVIAPGRTPAASPTPTR